MMSVCFLPVLVFGVFGAVMGLKAEEFLFLNSVN